MTKILTICSLIVLAACISGPDKKKIEEAIKPVDSTDVTIVPTDKGLVLDGCFMQVLKRDTFTASLSQQDNLVTGKMHFDNYEKDGSSGTVSGKLEGNVLKLHYSFTSEGMNSVMELYFKYRDGKLIRGTGEMNTRQDTAYFVNPALIKYDGGELQKIACQNLPAKYKN